MLDVPKKIFADIQAGNIEGFFIKYGEEVFKFVKLRVKTIFPNNDPYIKDEIIGKKVKVSIREGQILRVRHIEKEWTVREGQKVIIENNSSNIQILVDGIALNSAMKGESLKVLNESSGKTVNAWVKNNKKVAIFR